MAFFSSFNLVQFELFIYCGINTHQLASRTKVEVEHRIPPGVNTAKF
jgi:hypothetical protein